MKWLPLILAALAFAAPLSADPPKAFRSIHHCSYVSTDWADGDSFLIRKPDGQTMTVRLYGVDCLEYHVRTDSDSRRLRAQRRYFGITTARPTAKEAIEIAKQFGKAAADKTATLLKGPFTVHTKMQRALGDGRFERYYAYIECEDGSDLGTELVRAGLARAYGISADGPGDRTKEDWMQGLADIELESAKRGRGIWKETDWDKLAEQRRDQRAEEAEDRVAKDNPKLNPGETINPNTAARDELMKLPGIGETLALRIIEAAEETPFAKAEDLNRVEGIKGKTLERIAPYLDFK